MRPIISTGQVSSASCMSVWLVYEKIFCARPQAVSQSRPCSSSSRRSSSGTASTGWVSFRWMLTLSASWSKLLWVRR